MARMDAALPESSVIRFQTIGEPRVSVVARGLRVEHPVEYPHGGEASLGLAGVDLDCGEDFPGVDNLRQRDGLGFHVCSSVRFVGEAALSGMGMRLYCCAGRLIPARPPK
jgi:hypothetical protein